MSSDILTRFVLFFLAFTTTCFVLPFIIKIAINLNLFDSINKRKVHTNKIPNIGGIGIIFGFIVSQLFYILDIPFIRIHMEEYYLLLYSTVILFIMGLIDDIKHIKAYKKFAFQLLIALILVWKADMRVESFYGLFGLYELPLWISYIFSIMVFLFFINAYNLIDGLDGLSSSTGIYILMVFFGIFYINNSIIEGMITVSLMGALLGFFIFNKPPAKIFMGDSGSLSIGLIIAFFSIRISNLPLDSIGTINPVFPMIVLAYPAIDTLRVFFIRWMNGVSPFVADKNHIHHALLELDLSHGKSTIFVVGLSVLFSLVAYQLRLSPNISFFILVPLIILVSNIPSILLLKRK